jgi:spore germination protein YaaH
MPIPSFRLVRTILVALALALAVAVALAGAAARTSADAAAPTPTSGTVHAFLLASTGSSFEDFKVNYRRIGTVYPTFFACDRSNGRITGTDNPEITSFAKNRQVKVLARFDCQHTATLHRILNEPALRESTIAGLLDLVARHGYDGINLDFEAGSAEDRDAYTSFVTDLATRLHTVGRKLSIDVSAKRMDDDVNHPRSALFDYPALAKAADHVFVMAWGRHWQTSGPGPIADWSWFTKVIDYVASQPNPDRWVIGAPLYGFDWPSGSGPGRPGTANEYADLIARAQRVGATPQYDPATHESHFAYTDPGGVAHEAWYLSSQGVLERLDLARSRGFGVGVWRLGREDQSLWQSIG